MLAKAAYEALQDKAIAVTAVSPSLPEAELTEAQEVAQRIGIQHKLVRTDEMDNPNYVANPTNRCYFCKSELFEKLNPLAASWVLSMWYTVLCSMTEATTGLAPRRREIRYGPR